MKRKIYTVDALAGAGKTTSAAKWAVKMAKLGEKIAIVQPSKQLIEEFFQKVSNMNTKDSFKVVRLDSDTCDIGTVTSGVIQHLKGVSGSNAPGNGEILFITHATFRNIPYWDRKHLWTIIHDEVVRVDQCWSLFLPETHKMLTDHLSVGDGNPLHYRLFPAVNADLTKIAQNQTKDDTWEKMGFTDIARDVISPNCLVMTGKSAWNAYQNDRSGKEGTRFDVFSLLQPSIFEDFKQVIVMGAMLSDTVMSLYWANEGVTFKPFKPIEKGLRYRAHTNGQRLTISYLLNDEWSKNVRGKAVGQSQDGKAVNALQKLEHEAIQMFGTERFLYMENKDAGGNKGRLSKETNGVQCPNSPYGHNEYQDINNVLITSAINPTPIHYAFLESKGISSESTKMAYYTQLAYQAIMRCSIRNPAATDPVQVVVPDRTCAEFLARYFPGCSIRRVGDVPRLTKKSTTGKAQTSAQKNRLSAARKREKEIARQIECLRSITGSYSKGMVMPLNTRESLDFSNYSDLIGEYEVSVFASLYSSDADERITFRTDDEIIEGLRACHRQAIESKKANVLVSPAVFDPSKGDTYIQVKTPGPLGFARIRRCGGTRRGFANIKYVRGIWLDNDASVVPGEKTLTHEEFANIFPDLRIVAMNTASTTREVVKYRLFIPTSTPMTPEAYEIILANIEKVLNHHGFYDQKSHQGRIGRGLPSRLHGFDKSKFVPNSLFYLPSQSVADPSESFFIEYKDARHPLDPMVWLEQGIIHTPSRRDDWVMEKQAPLEYERTMEELRGILANQPDENLPPPAPGNDIDACPYIVASRLEKYRSYASHTDDKYQDLYLIARHITKNAKSRGYDIQEYEVRRLVEDLDAKDGAYHRRQDSNRVRNQVKNGYRDGK